MLDCLLATGARIPVTQYINLEALRRNRKHVFAQLDFLQAFLPVRIAAEYVFFNGKSVWSRQDLLGEIQEGYTGSNRLKKYCKMSRDQVGGGQILDGFEIK